MRHKCEVAVIGAGPAGLSAAIRLSRKGVDTILLAGCGASAGVSFEMIEPQGKAELLLLGITPSVLSEFSIPCYGVEALWGSNVPVFRSYLLEPLGSALFVDSQMLRQALLNTARQIGVRVVPGWCKTVDRESTWNIAFHDEQSKSNGSMVCDLVVDATGRSASIARMMGAKHEALDSQIAFMAVLGGGGQALTLVAEAVPYGWWYCFPIPNGGSLICLITDAELARQLGAASPEVWLNLFRQTRLIQTRVDDQRMLSTVMVKTCASHVLQPSAGDGWLSVGDAALAFDPLSSVGVLKALIDGARAAQAGIAWLAARSSDHADYSSRCLATYSKYIEGRRRHYRLEHRWTAQPFWAKRAGLAEKSSVVLSHARDYGPLSS